MKQYQGAMAETRKQLKELADDARLKAANINPATGLATDYLNHFNEIIMLIELSLDMPDMADDVLDWSPKDYAHHFRDSKFKDAELAIAAYDLVEPDLRAAFDAAVHELDEAISNVQTLLAGLDPQSPDPAVQDRLNTILTADLRPRIDFASALINGTAGPKDSCSMTTGLSNDAISALFD